jgi:hypothetical protein
VYLSLSGLWTYTISRDTTWRVAYSTMLARLHAVENPSREHVTMSGPFLGEGAFNIHVAASDAVVAGILRKAAACTASTCERCGTSGIGRVHEDRRKIFCARCFAAWDLFLESSKLLEVLASPGFEKRCEVFGFKDMKPCIRCLISEHRWRLLRSTVPGIDARYLLPADLFELRGIFERLRRYLLREYQVHTW